MEARIVAHGLGKLYRTRPVNAPRTLKALLTRGRSGGPAHAYWALRDVELRVEAGCMLGVIGRNGAGKSTLLKLIGGVLEPDEGSVSCEGRINALLDLGAGCHPDLTGRDNALVLGAVAGMSRRQVRAAFDDIVAFAELERSIDNTVRTYSSGMLLRLAFAVAVHSEPNVLLVDEALAVGDLLFQRKCIARISELKAGHCAIVLVSHDIAQIRDLCDSAIWLKEGRVAAAGAPEAVTNDYTKLVAPDGASEQDPQLTEGGRELVLNVNRFGTQEAVIDSVALTDEHGNGVDAIRRGQALRVTIGYSLLERVEDVVMCVTISAGNGEKIFDTNTQACGVELPSSAEPQCVTLHIDRLDLAGGEYFVDVGLYRGDWERAYDYHWHVYPLNSEPTPVKTSLVWPPHDWMLS